MLRKLRNISQAFILIFALSFTFVGCKRKYEEGPLISLRSKCKRLESGWKLEYFFIDGIDSTDAIYKSLGITNNRLVLNLLESASGSCNNRGPTDVRFESTIYIPQLEGYYYLSQDEKYLNMTIVNLKRYVNFNMTAVGPFFNGEEVEYRIKRLTSKDLWLDVNYKGKYCWIHFKS